MMQHRQIAECLGIAHRYAISAAPLVCDDVFCANTVFDFSDRMGPEYSSGEVPVGTDNAGWLIQGMPGRKRLLIAPPCLARSEAEVLIPREARHEVEK